MFRDDVGGGDGEDRGREQACAEQPDGEEDFGVAAGEGDERARGVGGAVDLLSGGT